MSSHAAIYMGRLDPDDLVFWALWVVLGAVAAGFELRTFTRLGARRAAQVTAWLTALMPVTALVLSVLFFRSGRAPVRQLNTDALGVSWFSAWSTTWLVLMLGLLAAAACALVFALTRAGGTRRACWVAVLAACLVGLRCVFWNFPDV